MGLLYTHNYLKIYLISNNNYDNSLLEDIYGIKNYKKHLRNNIDFENYEYDEKYKLEISKTEIFDWKFYKFQPNLNEQKLRLIVDLFNDKINNLKNSEDKGEFQDINSHNVILFFTDDSNDYDKLILNLLGENINKTHLPFIIFISNSIKKNKKYYDNYIKEISEHEKRDCYDCLNIYSVSLGKKTSEEINKILWGRACYFNELGNMQCSRLNYERDFFTDMCLNIMLIGVPGVGKSSTINEIAGEKIALEGAGKFVTTSISEYKIIRKFNIEGKEVQGQINLIDCPGFSVEGKELNEIEKKLNEKFQDLTNSKNFIHCVLYIFNGNTTRSLSSGEIKILRKIRAKLIEKNGKGKILFLINFLREESNPKSQNSFKSRLLKNLNEEFKDAFSRDDIIELNLKNDYENQIKQWGLKKVFSNLYNFFKTQKIDTKLIKNEMEFEELRDILISSMFFKFITFQDELLKKKEKTCQLYIDNETSSVKDVCWNFFDTAKIENSRKRMLSNIQTEFGFDLPFYKSDYELRSKEKTYSNVKFIPIIGTIIGGVGMSDESPKITREIGEEYLKKNIVEFNKNLQSTKNYISSINFYNNSVNLLEYLSQHLF